MNTATDQLSRRSLHNFARYVAAGMSLWAYDEKLSCGDIDDADSLHAAATLVRESDGMQIALSQCSHGAGRGRWEVRLSWQPKAWTDSQGTVWDLHVECNDYPKITRKATASADSLVKAILGKLIPKCEAVHAKGVEYRDSYQDALDARAKGAARFGLVQDQRGSTCRRTFGGYDDGRVVLTTTTGGSYKVEVDAATPDQLQAILAIMGHEVTYRPTSVS